MLQYLSLIVQDSKIVGYAEFVEQENADAHAAANNGIVVETANTPYSQDIHMRDWRIDEEGVVTYDIAGRQEVENQRIISLIKREAARRILDIASEYEQRNMLAEMIILSNKANPTAAETKQLAKCEKEWGKITTIRQASDRLEANPPEDIYDNANWTAT